MKIKIISDGTPKNTHVINTETGEEILCYSVEWSLSAGDRAPTVKLVLAMRGVALEVSGELQDDKPAK